MTFEIEIDELQNSLIPEKNSMHCGSIEIYFRSAPQLFKMIAANSSSKSTTASPSKFHIRDL